MAEELDASDSRDVVSHTSCTTSLYWFVAESAAMCVADTESAIPAAVSSTYAGGANVDACFVVLVESGKSDVAGTHRQNDTTLRKLRIQTFVRSSHELNVIATNAIPNCAALSLYSMPLLGRSQRVLALRYRNMDRFSGATLSAMNPYMNEDIMTAPPPMMSNRGVRYTNCTGSWKKTVKF